MCLQLDLKKDFSDITKKPDSLSGIFQRFLMAKEILTTRLSLLPLGGYVKIAGMVDESSILNCAKERTAAVRIPL